MIKANIAAGLADLAEAAYVDFKNVELGGLGGTALINAFRDKDNNVLPAWPESRRIAFAAEWRVVAHRPDTPSGFSATVFERLNPKAGESQFVFAARGTAGITDLVADIFDLTANGLAWWQIIDMYNWWQELTTPLGGTYQRASVVRVGDENLGQAFTIEEDKAFWRIDLTATVQSTTARLPAGAIVDVTGHSLGGHLATAFGRLFTASTANVVTVNGAGYSVLGVPQGNGNINRLFSALGGQATFPASQILNIYGDRGPELVTQNSGLVQPGGQRELRVHELLGEPGRYVCLQPGRRT